MKQKGETIFKLKKALQETNKLMNKYMMECLSKDYKIAILEEALQLAECDICELQKDPFLQGYRKLAEQRIAKKLLEGKE